MCSAYTFTSWPPLRSEAVCAPHTLWSEPLVDVRRMRLCGGHIESPGKGSLRFARAFASDSRECACFLCWVKMDYSARTAELKTAFTPVQKIRDRRSSYTLAPRVCIQRGLQDPLEEVIRGMYVRFIGQSLYGPWLQRIFVSPRLLLFGLLLCEDYECATCTPYGKLVLKPVLSYASAEDKRLRSHSRFHTDRLICFYARGCAHCRSDPNALSHYGLPGVCSQQNFREAVHHLWRCDPCKHQTPRDALRRIIYECRPQPCCDEMIALESDLRRLGNVPSTLVECLALQEYNYMHSFACAVKIGKYTRCFLVGPTTWHSAALLSVVVQEAEKNQLLAIEDLIRLFLTGEYIFDYVLDGITNCVIVQVIPDITLAIAWYAKHRSIYSFTHCHSLIIRWI